MKKIAYLVAAMAVLLTYSCSSDDNSGDTATNEDYLPLTTGNYWVYNTDLNGTADRDSLYIAGDTTINATTYKKFKTRVAPTGFFSGALSGNGVRKSGNKLLVTGSTAVSIQDFPVNISITDFAFFDAGATAGTQIGSTNGVINQTYNSLPLKFTYTLSTTAGETLSSKVVGTTTYNNVKEVITKLNLTISYDFSGIPITVLPAQDVVVSHQYYAKNEGMVGANTVISYTIQADLAATLGIPASTSLTQTETLATSLTN